MLCIFLFPIGTRKHNLTLIKSVADHINHLSLVHQTSQLAITAVASLVHQTPQLAITVIRQTPCRFFLIPIPHGIKIRTFASM